MVRACARMGEADRAPFVSSMRAVALCECPWDAIARRGSATRDGIWMHCGSTGMLFAGDTVDAGPIYAHEPGPP